MLVYRKLVDEWYVPSEVMDDIEAFTCLVYGLAWERPVDYAHGDMLKQMIGEDN